MNARKAEGYTVGELAKLAGVTVRTLHIWDEAGLLKPARTEWSQHRRYQQHDLLRLGQIMTLKHLGFTLREIRDLLDAPQANLKDSLAAQKAAVDHEIARLQAASFALSRTLKALDESDAPDWDGVAALIRSFASLDRSATIQEFFPPETWAWVQERAAQMPPEYVHASADAWESVYTGFRAVRHFPPDAPEVQAQAADMARLIEGFTASNPEIEAGLRKMYEGSDLATHPLHPAQGDHDLMAFMEQALEIYRQRRGES
ncbi:MAG: MerR family transcriptional regulator [Chloroflexi bacterium]|nr:MerR family transcriptional regulator [Chloroflexota bacterium]